jgi:Protein of unknown function (DUF2586)
MALTNVVFDIVEDGLGLIAASDDNISAIVFPSTAAPSAWNGENIKAYTDIYAVRTDGITATSVTYGEAHYHISEFFRLAGGALLYVCFSPTDLVEELYAASGGKVRQLAVKTANLADVQAVWQANANAFLAKYAPLSIICGYEPAQTPVSINALDDFGLKSASSVSVVAFGDRNGRGGELAAALGKPYLAAYGAVLGLVSKAAVHQNIGWLQRFNLTDGLEFSSIKYVTGEPYSDGVTNQYDLKRYLVPRKYAGNGGVFIEKDHTAYSSTKDLSNIRNNRTLMKALRLIRGGLLDRLKSPINVDTDGKLDADVIEYFKSLAENGLTQMQRDGEISAFGVIIDPNQSILQTGRLSVEIRIIPVGSAEFINIRLGFATSLAGF